MAFIERRLWLGWLVCSARSHYLAEAAARIIIEIVRDHTHDTISLRYNEGGPMGYADYSPEEVASRGEAIYEERIRPVVEKGNEGKFVIIDIESNDYEMDEDDLTATTRLLKRRPDAVIYGLRVGYPAAYNFGGHIQIESP